jgi:hypothetical protein
MATSKLYRARSTGSSELMAVSRVSYLLNVTMRLQELVLVLVLVLARDRLGFPAGEERYALSHDCHLATCPCHLYDLRKVACQEG